MCCCYCVSGRGAAAMRLACGRGRFVRGRVWHGGRGSGGRPLHRWSSCAAARCACHAAKEAKARGVIAASAGNHALALAYHGQDLGIPVTVVMPRIAPITKIQNCRELNANVLIQGEWLPQL